MSNETLLRDFEMEYGHLLPSSRERILKLMEITRQDEREKMQGADLSKMSEMLRSNSKETWIAAKGSDEGWNTWWKKRNQLNTN